MFNLQIFLIYVLNNLFKTLVFKYNNDGKLGHFSKMRITCCWPHGKIRFVLLSKANVYLLILVFPYNIRGRPYSLQNLITINIVNEYN